MIINAISATLFAVALTASITVHAQNAPAPSANTPTAATGSIRTLDTVVVTGSAPGPGLWHVYKNDDHEMWILGTLSPAPASIVWNSKLVVDLVADAQEVLWEPYYSVDVKSGLFTKLVLGYGMHKAERNPDGKSLKDVLSPALYARWAQQKARYLPGDRGVEGKRPLVAAEDLLKAAIQRTGLTNRRIVNGPILEAIKTHGVTSTAPKVDVKLSSATAKAALADVRRESLSDVACMEATLDAIEQDLPRMITNANAWAIGDLQRVSFTQLERQERLCSDALTDANFARKHGLPNIRESINARWMQEAEAALKRNRVTIAVAPLESILAPNGYVAQLRAQGYTVENP